MFQPSHLQSFLNSLGVHAKKSLSQNFLIDGNIIKKMLAESQLEPEDLVIEIGPGPGALTQGLLENGVEVLAIEKDEAFAKSLPRLAKESDRLHVFNEDITLFPLKETVSKYLKQGKKAKIIANLPYHLTTPILTQIISMHDTFSLALVMVQEEVARRITAKPKTKEYGSLTVLLHYFSQPSYAFRVSKNCYFPKPKVDSAVVSLQLHPPFHPLKTQEHFFKLTRTAFGKRRKMLRTSLKELYSPHHMETSLTALGLNPFSRPEDLCLQQFLLLFEELHKNLK